MTEGRDVRGGTGSGGGDTGWEGRRLILQQSSGASLWIRRWSGLILGFLGGGGGSGGGQLFGGGGGVGRGYGVPGRRRGGEGGGEFPSNSVRDLFKEGANEGFHDGCGEDGKVVVEAEGMKHVDEVPSEFRADGVDISW